MNKSVFKWFVFSAVAAAAVFSAGCKSKKPGADLYGSSNLYGDPLIGDMPMGGDNLGFPMDGDRSLFPPVYFAYDSSQVNPEEVGKVEAVAKHLSRGKGKGVIVEGHTDERGSREYNMALGERRALSVRDYLISLGANPATIHTKSYGEEMPEDPGQGEAAWRKNRRAVFAIY